VTQSSIRATGAHGPANVLFVARSTAPRRIGDPKLPIVMKTD